MRPSQGQRAMLGGPEIGILDILANHECNETNRLHKSWLEVQLYKYSILMHVRRYEGNQGR